MTNEVVTLPNSDLTESDMAKISAFVEEGMPGLSRVDDAVLYRMTEMYLAGSTYHQISVALNLPRTIIIYMSHTCGWYPSKNEYLTELDQHIKSRVINSNLLSQDFLLLLAQAYQKKITKKLQRYLATDDTSHTDEIDLKEIDKLLKTIEMIKDLNSEGKNSKGKTPAVGLNLGDGVTIERSGDNKVTITPKERVLGDVLSRYADKLRAEESNKKPNKTSDIKENVTKNEE
jgi:hypothetical protein